MSHVKELQSSADSLGSSQMYIGGLALQAFEKKMTEFILTPARSLF